MYIYLGTYYHTHHKGVISVIDENGEYVTLEKKIGKTIDLEAREQSLNRTKSPIGYTFLRAWKTGDDTDRVELAIHDLLGNSRTEGEWFADGDDTLTERLSGFMDRMGYPEVKLDADTEELITKIDNSSSSANLEIYKGYKEKYPNLFNMTKNNAVGNNSGDMNVYFSDKKSGFNVAVKSPDYNKFSCVKDTNFQDKFKDIVAEFGIDPAFNAVAGYIPRIDSEDVAINIFKKLLDAVKNKELVIEKTV